MGARKLLGVSRDLRRHLGPLPRPRSNCQAARYIRESPRCCSRECVTVVHRCRVQLELVRAQDDSSFGFKIEERGRDVFVVTGVRIRGPAARAGLSVGDQVTKFKVLSDAEVGWKPSVEAYEAWSTDTLNQVEANSRVQAIRIERVSTKKHPEGTSAKLARTRRSVRFTSLSNRILPDLDEKS